MSFATYLQTKKATLNTALAAANGTVNVGDLISAVSGYLRSESKLFIEAYQRGGGQLGPQILQTLQPFPETAPVIQQRNENALKALVVATSQQKKTNFCQRVDQLNATIVQQGTARIQQEANNIQIMTPQYFMFDAYCTNTLGANYAGKHAKTSRHLRDFCALANAYINKFKTNWGNDFHWNKNNQLCIQAENTEGDINKILTTLPVQGTIISIDDWLNADPAKRSTAQTGVQNQLESWPARINSYTSRRHHILHVRATINNAGASIVIYRYVSDGEKQSLIQNKMFNQKPGGGLEKEKWFTTAKDDVGNGVMHAFLCRITLKKGAFQALTGTASVDAFKLLQDNYPQQMCRRTNGQYENFIVYRKDNENSCFGIHEDALGLFNELWESIEIAPKATDMSSGAAKVTVKPVANFQANYPV